MAVCYFYYKLAGPSFSSYQMIDTIYPFFFMPALADEFDSFLFGRETAEITALTGIGHLQSIIRILRSETVCLAAVPGRLEVLAN